MVWLLPYVPSTWGCCAAPGLTRSPLSVASSCAAQKAAHQFCTDLYADVVTEVAKLWRAAALHLRYFIHLSLRLG